MEIKESGSARTDRRLFARRGSIGVALAGVLLLAFSLWVFAEMLDDVPKGEFSDWDDPLLKWMRGSHDPSQGATGAVALAKAITSLGGAPILSVISTAALVWLVWRRRWRAAVVFAVAAVGAPVVTNLLKQHYARARPNFVFPLVSEQSWSFPSGHALASSAIYLTLGIALAYGMKGFGKQVGVVAGGILLSFLIGLTRLYLGVHYPTDVIAGWSAGTAWALVCSAVLIVWEHFGDCRPVGAQRTTHPFNRW